MEVGICCGRTKEEAELNDRACGGDTSGLDRKADETVDSAVTALECVRVLLRRRQLKRCNERRQPFIILTLLVDHWPVGSYLPGKP